MQDRAHGVPTKLTRISYAYRGISEIAEKRDIELAGRITAEQRTALLDATRGEKHLFIPEQIGLEHLGPYTDWDFPSEGGHCWHELTDVEVLPHLHRSVDPTIESWEPLGPFVDKFVAAGRDGWDDVKFGTECGLRGAFGTHTDAQQADKGHVDTDTREVAPEALDRLAREVFGTADPSSAAEEDLDGHESKRAWS